MVFESMAEKVLKPNETARQAVYEISHGMVKTAQFIGRIVRGSLDILRPDEEYMRIKYGEMEYGEPSSLGTPDEIDVPDFLPGFTDSEVEKLLDPATVEASLNNLLGSPEKRVE